MRFGNKEPADRNSRVRTLLLESVLKIKNIHNRPMERGLSPDCSTEESSGLERYCLNEEFSDVRLEMDGESLPAHRVVLSAQSRIFKDLLAAEEGARVSIEKISIRPFETMLRFVYSGRYVAEDGTDDVALAQLYHLAEVFLLTGLTAAIRESIPNPDRLGDVLKGAAKMGAVVSVIGAAGLGTAFVGTAAATAALSAAGFTSAGIAAGSLAATVQAGIGNVVAGSAFATLQSVGATGGLALLGPVGLILGALGAVGGGIAVGVYAYKNRSRPNASKSPYESYYLDEKLSDATFLVDGEKIPVHRVILSARSDIFRSLFRVKDEKEIKLDDASIKPFKVVLKYVYYDRYVADEGTNDETLAQVYHLAERFQVTGLMSAIGETTKKDGLFNFGAFSRKGTDLRV